MEYVPFVAAGAIGLALGLYFGRLLTAAIHRENVADKLAKVYIKIAAFILGGGSAGAIIFKLFLEREDAMWFYILGLALGLIYTFIRPNLPPRYNLQNAAELVRRSDELRDKVPDAEHRALLVLNAKVPPKALQRAGGISEAEYAKRLEDATDAMRR